MNKAKFITQSLKESSETKLKIEQGCKEDILKAVNIISEVYRNGNKRLLCGNGGSAADCQHIATELMIRLSHHIQRPQ
jgi:D-sedoheptulose 7-phosphate isomerase